jgi:hypothetical protein
MALLMGVTQAASNPKPPSPEAGARWGSNRAGLDGPVMGGEGQSMALRGRHDQPIYRIGVEALRQLIKREH